MLQPDNNYFRSSSPNTFGAFKELTNHNGNNSSNNSNNSNSTSNYNQLFLAKVLSPQNICDQGGEKADGFLFVEQNDIIVIQEQIDEKWLLAKTDQQRGKLAIGSCQVLDDQIPLSLCQYLAENQLYDLHVCFASFVAQDIGDLSVTKGDIIVAINQVNEHWMQGQVCFDGQANSWPKLVLSQQVGTFPLNHCWQIDSERVKAFCHDKIEEHKRQQQQHQFRHIPPKPPFIAATHSASLSSGSSSHHSSDYQGNQLHIRSEHQLKPPRPQQLPRQQSASNQQIVLQRNQQQQPPVPLKASSLLTSRQQDKLKGWLHTVKKKTSRLSTRITASLGLISLTRDEEFERHYESFKHIEKTIRVFIKNLTAFVEHFENFLLALQNTSENLADFYRDKSHQKELEELRKKNKALACEHFHAFRRTVDRQVITVAGQLLQKFSGPQQLISKRSAKLLDYDTKTKEIESCRDLDKKEALRDQYVIAKDIYDRINQQLIEGLPKFNEFAIDIFRECILVLLESRKNLILSYTKQTASLLDTPLMMTYTASDVASSILMSCDLVKSFHVQQNTDINELLEQERKDSGQTSGHDTRQNSANGDEFNSRPHSAISQLSSEFDHMSLVAREISSTPLSQVSESRQDDGPVVRFHDEPDGPAMTEIRGGEGGLNASKTELESNGTGLNLEKGRDVLLKKEDPKEPRKKRKSLQIYIASWPFIATGPNQLTISSKQPLKLIKSCDECGNSDWSLVQDKKGQLGYVPSSYIKKKE